jgi:hypothetical protein
MIDSGTGTFPSPSQNQNISGILQLVKFSLCTSCGEPLFLNDIDITTNNKNHIPYCTTR